MVAFVLVHSPLVGPVTWEPVAEELRRRGHGVAVPALAGCTAPYWRNHVTRALEAAGELDNGPIVIVGHSGAGPLLPLIAQALGERAGPCIYVDAMLPTAGGSRIEHLPPDFAAELSGSAVAGLLPRWGESWPSDLWEKLIPDAAVRQAFRAQLEPAPLAIYTESIPDPPVPMRSAYLQFSEAYDSEAAAAAARGWLVRRIAGNHLNMLVEPAAVADALLDVGGRD